MKSNWGGAVLLHYAQCFKSGEEEMTRIVRNELGAVHDTTFEGWTLANGISRRSRHTVKSTDGGATHRLGSKSVDVGIWLRGLDTG